MAQPAGTISPEKGLEKVPQPGDGAGLRKGGAYDWTAYHNLRGMMTGEGAQAAYRDGGEAGYLAFLRDHMGHTPGLQPLAPGEEAATKAVRHEPHIPFVVTPAMHWQQPNQGPQTAANQTPPDDAAERRQHLRETMGTYAGLIATRRLGVGDALLQQERELPRWRSIGRRVVAIALNPLEALDYRRAEQLERQSAEAANAYRRALAEYAATLSADLSQQEAWQLWSMKLFESRVRKLMQDMPNGRGARLANFWLNGGKARRIGIVAVPAALIGAGLGVTVGILAAPAWVTVVAAVGAGYAGRAVAGKMASTVNRYQGTHQPTLNRMEQQATQRNADFAQMARQHAPGNGLLDVTGAYEQATREQAAANLRRKRRAEAVGGLAAVATFAAANGVATVAREAVTYSQLHPATTGVPHAPPGPVAPTPNTPPVPPHIPHLLPPHGLTHMYPWDAATQWNAAHHISTSPGSVWHTLHQAAAQYNMTHPGQHFDYILHSNGKFWLENGTQQLTQAQQGNFNTFLWNMSPPV